jgi:single-stranded-DNA-specific exonuclease
VEDSAALASGLGLEMTTATVLARRGLGDVERCREFLAANDDHPASAFEGIDLAVECVVRAVRDSVPITVYGDYDADGVAATSILVGLLREAGATCDWFIPDRIADGYGLNGDAIRSIVARGTGLVITVDCGVASPDEVELAKELGMNVVVTDHHQFGEVLPDCPILHPVVSGYPFEGLAGAGVAAKFAIELRRALDLDPGGNEADLDLVALATIADVMPLVDENRRLVREGLDVIRRARRIGMRALLSEAGVDPATVDATDLGFRLGPRINAVGRMYRADAGVELFLTGDPERAAEIGRELSLANAERRRVQQEVEAEARRALAGQDRQDRAVAVVAGEGWHPGVVGIVASHIAREEGMPTAVIALEGGVGKGSARSIPGVDLHRAIASQAALLETFGGHSAAAGLTIHEERIPEFREGLDRAIREMSAGLPDPGAVPVDGFTGGRELGLDLATEIGVVGPFGSGNPPVSLVVPSAGIDDPQQMGEGKHLRFTLESGGHRARAVWFSRSSPPQDLGYGFDVVGELSLNHWNGSVEPQFRVLEAIPVEPGDDSTLASADADEWWERFDRAVAGERPPPRDGGLEREGEVVEHGGSAEAVAAQVASSGESTLLVSAEAYRRWRMLGGSAIGRFGQEPGRPPSGAWAGSPLAVIDSLGGDLALTDYETLSRPEEGITGFRNVVLFDPPASARERSLAFRVGAVVHEPEDPRCRSFSLAAAAERHDPVPALRALYSVLRDSGGLEGEALRELLAGDEEAPRSPERAGMLIRVMMQAGIGQSGATGPVREFGVVSSEEVELERSEEFRLQAAVHKEQIEFLRR